ncbi:MAG TPA: YicC/YloC family endoribonuclease [Feifaniaceae bacterium]|nr:YicC/YloC family endoribonuclease [Feifaniaceae bacterium]
MISSMTGYGRGKAARDGREMTVELKSVNHRYLDIGMRLPRHLGFLEDVFRAELSASLSRGHVDIYVSYSNQRSDARTVTVDEALLSVYLTASRRAAEHLGLADDLTLTGALRLPDVTNILEAEEDREAVADLAREATSLAVRELKAMRRVEGERLQKDLLQRADTVLSIAKEIEERAPLVVEEYRFKLEERITALLGAVEVDRARLATEVALFADRASIDEEIVRLKSHVAQMLSSLSSNEPSGRKLDFIVQEMNREFNTIGSKANDAFLTNAVISGKGEIEKIREQVQNIE